MSASVHHHAHAGSAVIHWAHLYDLGMTLAGGSILDLHRRLLAIAAISSGERVLDVGCGPGRLAIRAAAIAGPGGEACGIDPSPEMIALARKKASRAGSPARFELAGVEALPFADGRFDAVVSNLVLHHLPEELKRRGFAEVRRVLRPGGRLVAVDFSGTPGHGAGHLLNVFGLRHGKEHAEQLAALLREAGFEGVEIRPTGRRAFAALVAQRPR